MLKITIHDTPSQLVFQLEGKLIGPWVDELAQSWQTAGSIRSGRRVMVDLTDVTFIDDAGKDLLARLRGTGAEFLARDPLTKAVIEEVTGATPQTRSAHIGRSSLLAHRRTAVRHLIREH